MKQRIAFLAVGVLAGSAVLLSAALALAPAAQAQVVFNNVGNVGGSIGGSNYSYMQGYGCGYLWYGCGYNYAPMAYMQPSYYHQPYYYSQPYSYYYWYYPMDCGCGNYYW